MAAELDHFVREALARGVPRAAIRERLLAAHWRPTEVDAALAAWAEDDFPVPVPRRRPYVPARVAFLHLVLFATLYATAYNVGAILFVLVDRWLPDVAHPQSRDASLALLRASVAVLIVALPIHLWMSRLVERGAEQQPEQRSSLVRRWLGWLTLFAAALVLIGDLVFLVTRLLSGELPPRIALKVAVVFAVAGVVFVHILGRLRRDDAAGREPRRPARWPERVAVAGAFAVLLAGLLAAGTPQSARRMALDAQRRNDLGQIADAINQHWRDHGRLPAALVELQTGQVWLIPTQDPVTQVPYTYTRLDSTHYELCAVFDAPGDPWNDGRVRREPRSRFESHPAGPHCFQLEAREPARPAPPR